MSLRRLKWAALAALVVYVAVLDVVRTRLQSQLHAADARLLMNALVLLGGFFLLGIVFSFIERLHEQLGDRNAELLALHRAALDIAGELDRETVLQKIVDSARHLVGAHYGALAVYDDVGHIESFLTSGLDDATRTKIGPPPRGHGILALVLQEGETLRLDDVGRHQRSAGFPPHHPQMRTLLAVPILCTSPFRGNLYLAEKRGGAAFTLEDERTLSRFATQASLAVDTSFLHVSQRGLAVAEERLRLAH